LLEPLGGKNSWDGKYTKMQKDGDKRIYQSLFGKRNTFGFRYFRVFRKMIIQDPLKLSGIFMNMAFNLSTCQCV
jgi:hypothetical protein